MVLLGFEGVVDLVESIVTRRIGSRAGQRPWGGRKTTALRLPKRRLDERLETFCLLSSIRTNEIKTRPSSDHCRVSRTYTFTLAVTVDESHEAFDDPEWFADAAWGALTNIYGLECVYTDVEVAEDSTAVDI